MFELQKIYVVVKLRRSLSSHYLKH